MMTGNIGEGMDAAAEQALIILGGCLLLTVALSYQFIRYLGRRREVVENRSAFPVLPPTQEEGRKEQATTPTISPSA